MAAFAATGTAPCTKFRHPSERHAIDAMHEIWGQHRGPRMLPSRAYLCPRCRYWHLTSQPIRSRVVPHVTHMTDMTHTTAKECA